MTARLNININDETYDFLKKRARIEGRTVTEIVRRMAGCYEQLLEQVEAGASVQFHKQDGSITIVSFL